MALDGDDHGALFDEGAREGSFSCSYIVDELPRLDAGLEDEAARPLTIESVPSPIGPGAPGHGGTSPERNPRL